jgi:hypothetical protein
VALGALDKKRGSPTYVNVINIQHGQVARNTWPLGEAPETIDAHDSESGVFADPLTDCAPQKGWTQNPLEGDCYSTQSAHFCTVSLPPQGITGTEEVEFFGDPSMMRRRNVQDGCDATPPGSLCHANAGARPLFRIDNAIRPFRGR